jgi:NAD(P)-dependent dehydrogenase (short-subunit alcohol dehydrogenase family)
VLEQPLLLLAWHCLSPERPMLLQPSPDHGEHSYRGAARLEGRAALVTDGDSGIGRAVAIAFAREGANVLIAYLNEHAEAEETARWVTEAGRRAVLVPGDIRDALYQGILVSRALAEFGRLDILVNNAAFQWAHEPLANASASEMEQALRTQSESVFFLAKTAGAKMKPGSSIINTSAMRASHPRSALRAYASNQGAVATFTASLAQLLAPNGIRVNAVAPGPVWTPRVLAPLSEAEIAKFGADTLLGRSAQPAEIAPAYVFLASSDASYITGAVLPVTGGYVPRPGDAD